MQNTTIQVFENVDFGKVRIVELNGEPWFVGKDVAEILGYSNVNKAIQAHVDEEDKKVLDYKGFSHFGNTLWGENDFSTKTLINESGVYSLILSSKLPKAKEFKHWVTADVIPNIRKTGKYVAPNAEPKVPNMDKLSLTTQCLINLELQYNALCKSLDNAVQRIEELESRKPAAKQYRKERKRPAVVGEPKKWDEREKDYLRNSFKMGLTDIDIAAELGRSISSIQNKRRSLGLNNLDGSHWTKAEDRKLLELADKGLTYTEISKIIGRKYGGVSSRLARLRKER